LFRWFVGLNMNDAVCDTTMYKKSKGQEAKLCYAGHVVMENRNGLAVHGQITKATGTAERDPMVQMLAEVAGEKRVTVGTDKAYDTRYFISQMRALNITAHVTQNRNGLNSAIDDRTTRHGGNAIRLRCRARIEEIFGWLKTVVVSARRAIGARAGRPCRWSVHEVRTEAFLH
jgi:hypothetical protein